jgi:superfamily II DNA or RNA helicase
MFDFREWLVLKESSEIMVSGPGIERMQQTFFDMAGRGAPSVYDYSGFNKLDWNFFLGADQYLSAPEIPLRTARTMIDLLAKYRKTQIPFYDELKDQVLNDITKATGAAKLGNSIIVFDNEPLDRYKKIHAFIPNLDVGKKRKINEIIDAAFEEESKINPNVRKEQDFYGNLVWPRFKKFSAEKGAAQENVYSIDPNILNSILGLLTSPPYNMEVEFKSGATSYVPPSLRPVEQPTGKEGETGAPSSTARDIEILDIEPTPYGSRLGIRFLIPFNRSKPLFDSLRSNEDLPKGTITYGQKGKFFVNFKDIKAFSSLVNALKEAGLNTKPLEDWKAPEADELEEDDTDEIVYIDFQDMPENKMRVKINYQMTDPNQKEYLRENTQYSFPNYIFDKPSYSYIVSGTYNQFVTFAKALNIKGYNVDKLRDIVNEKINSGRLQKTELEGRHDNDKQFINSIDENLPQSKFDLYDQQRKGVAFLYGRNSAILGDETGLGKTVQLITAAELRMQTNNRPTLIVTLKSTQQQWVDEIKNVIGEDKASLISTDPLNPKRYTVVYYENFSAGKKVPQYVDSLRNAGFGIIILDELHKVKHTVSKRSKNLAAVVETIPTRWGASATISANKPLDVRNQLMILGHHLGEINEKKFKRDFGGVGKDGGKPTLEDQIKAAERLNRWLNLSGVYVRRAKSDIRDMPNLEIGDDLVDTDQNLFDKMYAAKVLSYKDPDLAISKLIGAREVLATLKTDETTRRALSIVKSAEGKDVAAGKIVIFTNFIDAARNLVAKIQSGLKEINPNYYAITYLSETNKRDRAEVKNRFNNDPNAKILIMSMRMGGTGIDFPNAAQNMLINDFDWTPESAEQSEGRIYRINTNHPVKIRYVVSDGIDKELFDMVKKKRKIAQIIQKYRQDFLTSENDETVLSKIVDAQKEIQKIDQEMIDKVAKELPGAELAEEVE